MGVIAAEIHTSLCSPRKAFAVLPKVLLLSYPTVPILTLSSPGPEQGSDRIKWRWKQRCTPSVAVYGP